MTICRKAIDELQIINANGDVRICGWSNDNFIGNIFNDDIPAIMHSDRAAALFKPLFDKTYDNCPVDQCPYLANQSMDEHLISIDEIPDYPKTLLLAYEGICNYQCPYCSSFQHMIDTQNKDLTVQYDNLAKRLEQVLPHIHHIGANGKGELFCSKHILQLLNSWKPMAPASEVQVTLETNGSLFNEANWLKIENLGQYKLNVMVTVASFDERTYKCLHGTKTSLDRVFDNLRFIKNLREKETINYLEIATVVQELNFREMPEFTKRCLDEFGADCVRLRPINPAGGCVDKNIAWFWDVRNTEHPYNGLYKDVMAHPIFSHPKVLLWSGNHDSSLGVHPGKKLSNIHSVMAAILDRDDLLGQLAERMAQTEICLYGLGLLGKLIVKENKGVFQIKKILDKYANLSEYQGILVEKPTNPCHHAVLVTTYACFGEINNELRKKGFHGKIYNIFELMDGICN